MSRNILVTGGCGYIGTILVKKLLKKNFNVLVVDCMWFGNHLSGHKNLKIIKDDIRNIDKYDLKDYDSLIHLANIANDPSVELNPELSWDINVLAVHEIMEKIVRTTSIKHVVYASSGSVYGVKSEIQVTEDLKLVPISTYNKTKMIAEKVLLNYANKIKIHCIRPATVCGYSPRMRLDVTVNMLTYQALKKKIMTIHGGDQVRPNIHIQDLTDVFIHFLKKNDLKSGVYNAGFENLSIMKIAEKIKKKVTSEISILPINDIRSYRLDSTKLLSTGFKNKYNVENAIDEIINKFKSGKLLDDESCYTVKWMKHLKL
jgi:nucleoside-diphosphate-sugar epimerase